MDVDDEFRENFGDDNLIQAPESVRLRSPHVNSLFIFVLCCQIPKNYIEYAKQAKKMDMKKLKAAAWTSLTDGKADQLGADKVKSVCGRFDLFLMCAFVSASSGERTVFFRSVQMVATQFAAENEERFELRPGHFGRVTSL